MDRDSGGEGFENQVPITELFLAKYVDAAMVLEEVVKVQQEMLEPEDPRQLASQHELASAYQGLGRYEDAVALLEEVVRIRKATLKPEHPSTLDSMNDLALVFQQQGKYAEAETLQRQTLELTRRALGDDHPSTLASMNNLAVVFGQQGKYAKAETLQRQTFELMRRALGDNHPSTLDSMNNLAVVFRQQGKYAKAETLQRQTLELTRRALGDNHPSTLDSMNNLAVVFRQQGKYAEAETLQQQTLELTRRALGDNHPSTLDSINNLAVVFRQQGKCAEAETLQQQTLELTRRALGDDHPSTLASINNLAVVFRQQGKYVEAETLQQQTLELTKRALGDDHPSTLDSMNNLAVVFQQQGKYAEAETLQRQTLELKRAALGDAHSSTLDSMNNLAVVFQQQGKYAVAETLQRQTLELKRAALGDAHSSTLDSMNNLAVVFQQQGKYAVAETLQRQTLELTRASLGDAHPSTLQRMNNLAIVYKQQGNYAEAETLQRQTLELTRTALDSINNLVIVYKQQGNYAEAEALQRQMLELTRAALGDAHPSTLDSINNLAIVYKQQGKYVEAEALQRQTLELKKTALGDAHPSMLDSMNNLAEVYRHQGKYVEAEVLQEQIVKAIAEVSAVPLKKQELSTNPSHEGFFKGSDDSSFHAIKVREVFKRLRLYPRPPVSTLIRISYQVSWDLPFYLNEFFDPRQKLSEVLTLTAGLSDKISDCFATSVGDYMKRTWKGTGILLLGAIEAWLLDERKGETVQRNSEVEIRIANGARSGIPQSDWAGKTTNAKILVKAKIGEHMDCAEALYWLCASLRVSPHEALSMSNVDISEIATSNEDTINLAISPSNLVVSSEIDACWSLLFTQSVVAPGFQIPAREEGKGLEISFPNMAMLAGVIRLVEYDKGLVGEGLNTLLVPIKLLNKDQAIQWHIEEKLASPPTGGEYARRSVTSILSSLDSWYRELLPDALASKRAFLGWTNRAKVTIGTMDGPTDVKDSGTSSAQRGGLYITSYNATVSSGGLGFGGPGFGVAAAPARAQSYCMRNNPTILAYKLKNAAKSQAILYDAGEKIAWQVPQSCLMLQMIHAAIRHWDLRVESSQGSMRYAEYEESYELGRGDGLAALEALSACRDLKFSMQSQDKDTCNDMLERLCLSLERVTEFHAEQKSKPERGGKKPPKWITGIELNDVIQEQNIWRAKESKVDQPWAHLADDTCPIFFCKNLGQAIVPTDFKGLCNAFRRVPTGKDYFVTSGVAVCQMLARHEHNDGARLSEKVQWQALQPMIQLHTRRRRRGCTHTNQLLCETPFQFRSIPKVTRSKVERHSEGAFIFHGSPGLICSEPILAADLFPNLQTNELLALSINDTVSEKELTPRSSSSIAMAPVNGSRISDRREATAPSSSSRLSSAAIRYRSYSRSEEEDEGNVYEELSEDLSNELQDLLIDRLSTNFQFRRSDRDGLLGVKARWDWDMAHIQHFDNERDGESNADIGKGKGKEIADA